MTRTAYLYRIGVILLSLFLLNCGGGGAELPKKPATAAPAPAAKTSKVEEAAPVSAPPALKKEDPNTLFQYDPEGRRDPFKSIIVSSTKRTASENLPPLQRRELAELKLIGLIWGGFGYGAILQTPDGKGYPVRKGTRVGLNHGVINRISAKAVVIEERFLDIFGEKKVREVVMELHPQKEGLE